MYSFLFYFLFSAVASLLPYIAVYMKQLGLSPSESALIYGTVPFLGAIVRPIIGALADKLHAHKVSDIILWIKLSRSVTIVHCS